MDISCLRDCLSKNVSIAVCSVRNDQGEQTVWITSCWWYVWANNCSGGPSHVSPPLSPLQPRFPKVKTCKNLWARIGAGYVAWTWFCWHLHKNYSHQPLWNLHFIIFLLIVNKQATHYADKIIVQKSAICSSSIDTSNANTREGRTEACCHVINYHCWHSSIQRRVHRGCSYSRCQCTFWLQDPKFSCVGCHTEAHQFWGPRWKWGWCDQVRWIYQEWSVIGWTMPWNSICDWVVLCWCELCIVLPPPHEVVEIVLSDRGKTV